MTTDLNLESVRELFDTWEAKVDSVIDLVATHEILHKDVLQLLLQLRERSESQDEEGVWLFMRSAIRAQFAYIEFTSLMFVRLALIFEERAEKMSVANLRKANQVLANSREGRMPTSDTIKFAIKCLRTAFELSFEPNFVCQQWEDFREAMAKRDGFMHPKKRSDVTIGFEDGAKIMNGIGWMVDVNTTLLAEMQAKMGFAATAIEPQEHAHLVKNRFGELRAILSLIEEGKVSPLDALAWIRETNIGDS